MPPALSIALSALGGLFLGSVVNLIVWRLPRQRSLFRRPACTHCGRPLSWEAFPILGYALQRGRCRHCGGQILWAFPLTEALTAAVFGLLAWRLYGVPWLTSPLSVGLAGLYAVYALALIPTLFLDWLHHDIYYLILIPPTLLALVAPLLGVDGRLDIRSTLLGLGSGLLFFGLLFAAGQVLFRSQALGLGDVWLAGMIGAMCGFYGALLALSAGIVLAAVGAGLLLLLRRASPKDYMPYGSYLCLAALGYLCFVAP